MEDWEDAKGIRTISELRRAGRVKDLPRCGLNRDEEWRSAARIVRAGGEHLTERGQEATAPNRGAKKQPRNQQRSQLLEAGLWEAAGPRSPPMRMFRPAAGRRPSQRRSRETAERQALPGATNET